MTIFYQTLYPHLLVLGKILLAFFDKIFCISVNLKDLGMLSISTIMSLRKNTSNIVRNIEQPIFYLAYQGHLVPCKETFYSLVIKRYLNDWWSMLGQSKQDDQILANSTQSWKIRGGGRDVVTSRYLLTSHEKSQRGKRKYDVVQCCKK